MGGGGSGKSRSRQPVQELTGELAGQGFLTADPCEADGGTGAVGQVSDPPVVGEVDGGSAVAEFHDHHTVGGFLSGDETTPPQRREQGVSGDFF